MARRSRYFTEGLQLNKLLPESSVECLAVAVPVKKTKMKIPKKVKADVWNTYIGADINKHKCLCCKRAYICCNVDFAVGHVISEKDGGTLEIANLRPICATCNSAMGTMNMVDFIKKFGYYL